MPAPTVYSGAQTSFDSGSVTSHPVAAPSTRPEGAGIYIAFATDASGDTITPPAGFAAVSGSTGNFGNLDVNGSGTAAVFRKIAAASEPSSYTVTTGIAERGVAVAFAVANDNGTHEISLVHKNTGTSANVPSIGTAIDDCLLIRVVATDRESAPHGAMAGYTKLGEISFSSAATLSVHRKALANAGAENNGAVSLGAAEEWAAVTFAIAPKPTGAHERRRISASANDAEQLAADSTINLDGTVLDMGRDLVGLRFASLQVPAASTIHQAYVKFVADADNTGTASLRVRGESVDSAGAFTTTAGSLSARLSANPTTALANISPENWTVNVAYRLSGLASIIAEIVARPGWTQGNALTLFVQDVGSTARRRAKSWDNSTALAPLLVVDYTQGNVVVNLAQGSLSVTGHALTVAVGATSFGLALGDLDVTGYAITITETQTVALKKGGLAVTGYALTVAVSDVVIDMVFGEFVLMGHRVYPGYGYVAQYPYRIIAGGAHVEIEV